MKTKCYCLYCTRHPLHDKRDNFNVLTGYEPGQYISAEFNIQGKEVDCLSPLSDAFIELDIKAEDFEWKVTAYGDGSAITGVEGVGFTLFAGCGNETFVE